MAKQDFSGAMNAALNGRNVQLQEETPAAEKKEEKAAIKKTPAKETTKTTKKTSNTKKATPKKQAKPAAAAKKTSTKKTDEKRKVGRPEGKTKEQITLTINTDIIKKLETFGKKENRKALSKYIELNIDEILKEMEKIKPYM